MASPLLWITEDEVVSLVPLDDAIDALERGVESLGAGGAFNVPKALGTYDDGSSLHALASGAPALGYAGFKTWVNTKRGATAIYTLFDANDGSLAAVIEAGALGQLRTSAMTGLGTRWLAPRGIDDMALVGTGTQAITQVAAVNAVRPLRRLRVWSPTAEKRRAFVARIADEFDFDVVDAPTLEAATRDAPLVTVVTRAKEPFLHARMFARGAHVNAVGAILPANAELMQDVFDRVDFIAVDDVVGAQRASKEFVERFGPATSDWSAVHPLGEVIARKLARPDGCDLSLFKSMGMGISDLSVAILVIERARARGAGRTIDAPRRAVPRWNAMPVRA